MRSFHFIAADTTAAALQGASGGGAAASGTPPTQAASQFLAGGTTLLDLMKLDVMRPQTLIDINGLKQPGDRGRIESSAEGIRFGALVSMAEAAEHPAVLRDYPVIAQTLKLAASAQLRNMASLGGNVLQRTRCMYFRDVLWPACNKREPGSGCAAMEGINRAHAVLGTSDACIATYPGDFAQALMALDARVDIAGRQGQRTIAFAELHRLPGSTPHIETALAPGELITAISVPAGPWTRRSHYVKIRDRDSYQFALASAAVALDMGNSGVVRDARIALGGVATVPWRAREAEALLRGKPLDEGLADAVGQAAFADASARQHNAFKVGLGQRTVARALLEAARLQIA